MKTPTQMTERQPWMQPWMRPWWQHSKGNGPVLFYIVTIHALALAGLILFPAPRWPVIVAGLALLSIGGIGTTVCSHRCLAHRSLRLNRVIEKLLIFFTIFNASGEPITWVANHRQHHAKADTAEGVSSPRHGGFWWSHIRWVYQWSYSDVSRWWQVDIGWYVICGLNRLGLASSIRPAKEQLKARGRSGAA